MLPADKNKSDMWHAGVEVKVNLRSRSRSMSDGECTVTVDIGYGGAFYAVVDGHQLGLDVRTSPTADLVDAANAVTGLYLVFYHHSSILCSSVPNVHITCTLLRNVIFLVS